nr:hypothetical protein [Angustibacter aerolatus]
MTTTGQFAGETGTGGEWKRQRNRFAGRITTDSDSAPGEGPDAEGRWPVEPGRYRLVVSLACPWAHRSVIVREPAGPAGRHLARRRRPGARRARLAVLARRGPPRPGAGHRVPVGGVPAHRPRVRPAGHRAVRRRHRDRARRHQRLPADHPRPVDAVARVPRARRPRPVPRRRARRDGPAHRGRLPRREQRRVPLRVRHHPGGVRGGVRHALRPARRARGPAGRPPVPHGRPRARGRRAAVHHAGAVRRGLPRPLQDQPAEGSPSSRTCGATRESLFQDRGFGDTVDFDHIKRHYYVTHDTINPTGIVPKGPDPAVWHTA